jgi:DNA-binding transcriptional MerR regulator
MSDAKTRLLRVGELAKVVGKSVRAIHLYEELGLLRPESRTSGGFRLFAPEAVARINWITKLQAMGFSLSEIQGFIREFEAAGSGREATGRARQVFSEKLAEIRQSIAQLHVIENDLVEAIGYIESCDGCVPAYKPDDCHVCDHHGHAPGRAPELFAGLSHPGASDVIDVELAKLRREEPN